jgi:nicotinate-nucleotide adenylyltransferase
MRTLIIGGTFNPPHLGHLAVADEARAAFGFVRTVFVPAFRPPHKEVAGGAGPAQRLAMLRIAVVDFPGAAVEECEIERESISYTIDTIACILRRYDVEGKPGLLIGDDLAEGFSSWREPESIAAAVRLIVARRNAAAPPSLAYPHELLDNPLLPISSTDIRRRVAEGKPFRYLVPEGVYRYIVDNHVYYPGR